jgi:exopolyphosphatase/guanosine-5'-triphosphate,3'-diphosphate pyrophosphatase
MKAAIDIGTNTALLLVAEISDDTLTVLHEEQRIPRLGQGVDDSRQLSIEAMGRVIKALNEYRNILDQRFPSVQDVYVTATSAVRDARNRSEFLKRVRRETDYQIKILSGFEEAQYTFLGAQSMLDAELIASQNVVIDIGGGSTELVLGSREEIQDRYSYDMGCVRYTERFLQSDPPMQRQINACKEAIRQTLEEYDFYFPPKATLIGVAGTVTSLAFIDKQMDTYNSKSLTGHVLTKEMINSYIHKFQKLSSSKLLKLYPQVMEGRADIFLAGLLILLQVMETYNFQQLIVSTGGIRHGTICIHSE